jgi:hypothetical protein
MSEDDERARQEILGNLMGMSVEDVVGLIGDLTVRDALEVLRREQIVAEEAVAGEEARAVVEALLGQLVDPFRGRINTDVSTKDAQATARSNVAALAGALSHTVEAGVGAQAIPNGREPAVLRDPRDGPTFGAWPVYPGGQAVAYGSNMNTVSGIEVDRMPVDKWEVVSRDQIAFTVPADADEGCVEIFSETVAGTTPKPIVLRVCVDDDDRFETRSTRR